MCPVIAEVTRQQVTTFLNQGNEYFLYGLGWAAGVIVTIFILAIIIRDDELGEDAAKVSLFFWPLILVVLVIWGLYALIDRLSAEPQAAAPCSAKKTQSPRQNISNQMTVEDRQLLAAVGLWEGRCRAVLREGAQFCHRCGCPAEHHVTTPAPARRATRRKRPSEFGWSNG